MDTRSPFNALLHSAAAQPEPQRMLFVLAAAALPDDAAPAERDRFTADGGGTLAPVVERVRSGTIGTFLVPDRPGETLQFI